MSIGKQYWLEHYTEVYCKEKNISSDSEECERYKTRYSKKFDKELKSARFDEKWFKQEYTIADVAFYADVRTRDSLYLYTKQHWKDQIKTSVKFLPIALFVGWLLNGGWFFFCVTIWMLWFSWDCCCNGGARK